MFKSINPTTGNVIAEYPEMTNEVIHGVLKDAQEAQHDWRNVSFRERAYLMLKTSDVLLTNKEKYAQLMTDEMGKITPRESLKSRNAPGPVVFTHKNPSGFWPQKTFRLRLIAVSLTIDH